MLSTLTLTLTTILLTAPIAVMANTFRITGYSGLRIAGSGGCGGDVVINIESTNSAAADGWSDCWNSHWLVESECVQIQNIDGDEDYCEVEMYYLPNCQGDYDWIDAKKGQTISTGARYPDGAVSFRVACSDD